MKVIAKRKWRVVDARPPQASLPGPTPRNVAAQASTARDGIIEAVARTPILGFRDDVVVRVRPTADGARIDVRSASRYGRNDLGTNAARVRNLLDDIDDGSGDAAAAEEAAPSPPPVQAGKGAVRQAVSAGDRGRPFGRDRRRAPPCPPDAPAPTEPAAPVSRGSSPI